MSTKPESKSVKKGDVVQYIYVDDAGKIEVRRGTVSWSADVSGFIRVVSLVGDRVLDLDVANEGKSWVRGTNKNDGDKLLRRRKQADAAKKREQEKERAKKEAEVDAECVRRMRHAVWLIKQAKVPKAMQAYAFSYLMYPSRWW